MNRKKTKNKVLVTGATGFIGSYLCEALLKEGYSVLGLAYGDKKKIKNLNKNFKLLECDVSSFKVVEKIIKKYKPEGILHLAAILPKTSNDNPFPFLDINVGGTLNIMEACRLHNVKKVIYSSSMSVYGKNPEYLPVDEKHPVRPYNFYSLTKLLAEEVCSFYAMEYGINVAVLRYSGVYGANRHGGAVANFVKNATKGNPLTISNNISWDIVHAEDVAKANISAFKKLNNFKFEIINIGSGKELNIKDLAEKIIKSSSSKSKIKISNNFYSAQQSHFYYNISKAERLLEFKSQDFDVVIEKYINQVRNNNLR